MAIKRIISLALAFFGLCQGFYAQSSSRPNIILILADDLGYGDLGCYGSRLAPTPHIDRIAAEGVRCMDGYAAAATCAPSRLGLMSGRYQQRMGAYSNSTSPNARIPESHLLMPQMLKAAGYRTAHIGKWHINRKLGSVFDEVYNATGGAADYFPGPEGTLTGKVYKPMRHGWSPEEGTPYMTDAHGDSAADFIRSQAGKAEPFFLYLAFNAPHSPWQAPLELKKQFGHISPEVMGLYAAMVHSLDRNVGKVLQQLDESGIAGNTLVVFMSDNGPEWGRDYPAFNWPAEWDSTIVGSAGRLSGRKAQFLEGGIRVPFILRWPDGLKAGTVYQKPVSALDLYETFRKLAKGPETQTDGIDLTPYLTGRKQEDPHRTLFWQGGATAPIYARDGRWKLSVPQEGGTAVLYNLQDDIAERHDVSRENPSVVAELLQKTKNWKASIKRSQQ